MISCGSQFIPGSFPPTRMSWRIASVQWVSGWWTPDGGPQILDRMGHPHLDMFATTANAQLARLVSPCPAPWDWAVKAMCFRGTPWSWSTFFSASAHIAGTSDPGLAVRGSPGHPPGPHAALASCFPISSRCGGMCGCFPAPAFFPRLSQSGWIDSSSTIPNISAFTPGYTVPTASRIARPHNPGSFLASRMLWRLASVRRQPT